MDLLNARINDLYDQTLRNMERVHKQLALRVPQPKEMPFGEGYVIRYEERNVHQAIVQKLARVVSGLHAARLLVEHGFFQEQATLQRTLDEFYEDIQFLAFSVPEGSTTALHERYLESFFQEEFDSTVGAIGSPQRRDSVPRQKIRAYLARNGTIALDASRGNELMRTIEKTYSGFVHGASPQIMDMCYGEPPHFHLSGMLGTTHEADYRADLWNYFYRGIISFSWAAWAFGDDALHKRIVQYSKDFAQASGEDYSKPPPGWHKI